MSVRYDPLLVRALAREIALRWSRCRVSSLNLLPAHRIGELRFADDLSLLFLLHPEQGYMVSADPLVPGRVAPGPGIEFRRLWLTRAWTPPDERTLFLSLTDARDHERYRIAVELATNQWNLLLLEAESSETGPEAEGQPEATESPPQATYRIRACLWTREAGRRVLRRGGSYTELSSERAWREKVPSLEEWRARFADLDPAERRLAALSEVAYLSPINVDHVLGEADRRHGEEAWGSAWERYTRLREQVEVPREDSPPEGWLLPRPWGEQPYPCPLGETEARRLPSLLEAMGAAGGSAAVARLASLETEPPVTGTGATASPATAQEEAHRLRKTLLARRRRLRKRRAALRRELEKGPPPEELRATGNLILARLREIRRGIKKMLLEDFDGSVREVSLDPRLEPAANAETYFREAARRERAAAQVPEQIANAQAALAAVEEALQVLEKNGSTAALWEVAGGRRDETPGQQAGRAPPYLRLRSSGGLEIRVGRSARTNDELTFHHSAPEDIWLHARQSRGAHVILRWGRRDENPPRQDLHEAAVAAALHSDARHSGTVAVDWTRRKYVRKPRKAPPGTVVIERVKTVFVEPDERLVERMRGMP